MTPPSSREPGQAGVTDAEARQWQDWAEEHNDGVEGNHDEMFLRILADRTRDKERIEKLEKHNVKLQDTLSEYMLTMAKPAEGFKNEEEYVGWQRAVNHWEREGRALLEVQDDPAE